MVATMTFPDFCNLSKIIDLKAAHHRSEMFQEKKILEKINKYSGVVSCCCCCCSHSNSHIQVRGHRTGSGHSGAEEYPREKHKKIPVMQMDENWYTNESVLSLSFFCPDLQEDLK